MIQEDLNSWQMHHIGEKSNNNEQNKMKPILHQKIKLSSKIVEQHEVEDKNSYISLETDVKRIISSLSAYSGLFSIDNQDYYYKKNAGCCPSINFDTHPQNYSNISILNDIVSSKKIKITPQNKHFLFQLSILFNLPDLIRKTADYSQKYEVNNMDNYLSKIILIMKKINSLFFFLFDILGFFQIGFQLIQGIYHIFLNHIGSTLNILNFLKILLGFIGIFPLFSIPIIIIYHITQSHYLNKSFFYTIIQFIQMLLELDDKTDLNLLLSVYCPIKRKYENTNSIISFLSLNTCGFLYASFFMNDISIINSFIFKFIRNIFIFKFSVIMMFYMVFALLSFYYPRQKKFLEIFNFDNPILNNLFLSCPKLTYKTTNEIKSFDLLINSLYLIFLSSIFHIFQRSLLFGLLFLIIGFISFKLDFPFILYRKYLNYCHDDWYITDEKLQKQLHEVSLKSSEKEWENWATNDLLFSNRLKNFRMLIISCRIVWILLIFVSGLLRFNFQNFGRINFM